MERDENAEHKREMGAAMKVKRRAGEGWVRTMRVRGSQVWAVRAQHIMPLAAGPGAKFRLVLHTQAFGEAEPGVGITQVSVWKEEVSRAALRPTG